MSRQPSEATQIRALRKELSQSRLDRLTLFKVSTEHECRANKAEQELKEWKERFDLLLRRTPEITGASQ